MEGEWDPGKAAANFSKHGVSFVEAATALAKLRAASNVVVLVQEVAKAFPNADAVNEALLGLIALAKATAGPARKTARSRAKA